MEWKTVKKASDIKLDGVTVDLEFTDGNITSISLRSASKPEAQAPLFIRKTDWSFGVYVPALPKMVKRYRIAGELRGLKYEETHDTREAAAERLREITDAAYIGSESDAIVEVEVPEEG